jgi:UPF0716 protein FxsA
MFARLFLLFIIVPLTDLFLLLWLAKYTGLLFTVGLVICTAAIGAWLAKQQGLAVQSRIRQQLQQQQMPSELLTDGAMILLAAGLLLTPGLLTDCFGFSLLTPVCRRFYKSIFTKWLKKNFKVHVIKPDFSQGMPRDANTVDGEVVREKPDIIQPERIED